MSAQTDKPAEAEDPRHPPTLAFFRLPRGHLPEHLRGEIAPAPEPRFDSEAHRRFMRGLG
jgi:hypothetical protein